MVNVTYVLPRLNKRVSGKLQPDGLEEIRMYPVHYLRILTRIIRLRQGDKLLMSEEKPQKRSRQWSFLSKSVPSL